MNRTGLLAGLALLLSGCPQSRLGKVILTEDTDARYVQLRGGEPHVVYSIIGQVDHRPELDSMRQVNGDLDFICRDIQGVRNPRIVIESKDKRPYHVVFKWGDQEALKVIAKPLGLIVAQEEREIRAITIRQSAGGHRLKPAAEGKRVELEEVCGNEDGTWPLEGVTADELARFLETRYWVPVVNLTSLRGRWSIILSREAEKLNLWLEDGQIRQLDDLGLELKWEKIKIPVTVVNNAPR